MTKIVKFLKPYMGATVAALFFSLFNNLMQLILPAMMALMINTGIGDGRMGTVQLGQRHGDHQKLRTALPCQI